MNSPVKPFREEFSNVVVKLKMMCLKRSEKCLRVWNVSGCPKMDDAGSFLKICSKSTTTSLGLILGRIINSRLFTSALAALEWFSIAAKGTMVWSPMNRIDDPPSHLSVVGSPWSHRTQVPSPSNEV